MRKYYSKEIPESPVYVAGHPLIFDFMETEDPTLISELDKCVARGVGGVLTITAEQYAEEVKKKANGNLSANGSKQKHQRQELTPLQWDVLRAAAANDGVKPNQFARPQQPDHRPHNRHGLRNPNQPMPDPIEVPTAQSFPEITSKPPTAKMKDLKT